MREKIVIPEPGSFEIVNRKKPTVCPDEFVPYKADDDDIPPMAAFGDGYRWHVTGLTSNDWGFPTNEADEIDKKANRIIRKVDRCRDEIVEFKQESMEDAEIMVVSYGSVSRSALRAIRELRLEESGRTITLWPFRTRRSQRSKESKAQSFPNSTQDRWSESNQSRGRQMRSPCQEPHQRRALQA